MGQIVVEQMVTADGFTADENKGIDWHQAAGDFAATEQHQLDALESASAILLGANTHRMFAAYWPFADPAVERIAKPINALPKYVVSSTLRNAPWGQFSPAEVRDDDGVAVARSLKDAYDGDIVVWGSLQLCEALFAAGVVDRLRLRVVPVLIGRGIPIAAGLARPLPVTPTQVVRYPSGHVQLDYRCAASADG